MISNILFMVSFSACQGIRLKKYTPKEFLNHTLVNKSDYTKDSILLIKQFGIQLSKHEDFFNDTAYFDSTQLIIDSIIYSPDLKKMAAFIITKNPTYRQIMPDEKYEWYYEATLYLGVRQNDSISLSWPGPSFTNSYNKRELSHLIRDSYFTEFVTKDSIGPHTYKYNLNDIRFWNCSIWKEVEDKKIQRRLFEEEKKKHPENIYEPKKRKNLD